MLLTCDFSGVTIWLTSLIFGSRFLTCFESSIICAIHSISVFNRFYGRRQTIFIDSLTLFISWIHAKVFLARWKVTRLSELLLSRHVVINWHVCCILGNFIVVRCILVCWKCNLDATSSSRAHFALPFAGHCRIESCLLSSLRSWTRFTASRANYRQVLICFHYRTRCVTHLLLDTLARSRSTLEGWELRFRKLIRRLMLELRWWILRHN